MTAPNTTYSLSSFGTSFSEQPAPWENESDQFQNLSRNQHVQSEEMNRFTYPTQASNIPSSSNMNFNFNSDFILNEQKGIDIEGEGDFTSHFPGPPIQTNKTCQQGPDGCNLFIFHIPNDLTNMDLYNLFTPFGAVISARIMVENETGRSRGFGFVSFDHPSAAHTAIRSMNGFQIGHKRLKVAHKKEMRDGGSMFNDDLMLPPSIGRGAQPMNGRAGAGGFTRNYNMTNQQYNNMRYNNAGPMPTQQQLNTRSHRYPNQTMMNDQSGGNLENAMSSMYIGNGSGGGGIVYGRPQQGVNQISPQQNVGHGFGSSYAPQQQFNNNGYQQHIPQNQFQQPLAPSGNSQPQMEMWLPQQQQAQQLGVDGPAPSLEERHDSIGSSFTQEGSPDSLFLEAHQNNMLKQQQREDEEGVLGNGFDLLNNVRKEFSPKSLSPALTPKGSAGSKEDMWGSAPNPTTSIMTTNPNGVLNEQIPTSSSLSPPKSNILGAIKRSTSSLSNRSETSSNARVSPSTSPNRGFSPSPVSVVTTSNKNNNSSQPPLSSNGNSHNEVEVSTSSSPMPIQGSPQASALTSALNPSPPSVNVQGQPDAMISNMMPSSSSSSSASGAVVATPMSTEQILMMQEQLKQQQALIAGQNELLQTLLAQQQAMTAANQKNDSNQKN